MGSESYLSPSYFSSRESQAPKLFVSGARVRTFTRYWPGSDAVRNGALFRSICINTEVYANIEGFISILVPCDIRTGRHSIPTASLSAFSYGLSLHLRSLPTLLEPCRPQPRVQRAQPRRSKGYPTRSASGCTFNSTSTCGPDHAGDHSVHARRCAHQHLAAVHVNSPCPLPICIQIRVCDRTDTVYFFRTTSSVLDPVASQRASLAPSMLAYPPRCVTGQCEYVRMLRCEGREGCCTPARCCWMSESAPRWW